MEQITIYIKITGNSKFYYCIITNIIKKSSETIEGVCVYVCVCVYITISCAFDGSTKHRK